MVAIHTAMLFSTPRATCTALPTMAEHTTRGTVYKATRSGGTWNVSVIYSFGALTNDGQRPSADWYWTVPVTFTVPPSRVAPTATARYSNYHRRREAGPRPFSTLLRELKMTAVVRMAGLVFDRAGNLYGATWGTRRLRSVFELSPQGGGWNFTTIYTFVPELDLSLPWPLMPPAICTAQANTAVSTAMATFASCRPQAAAGGRTPTSTTLPAVTTATAQSAVWLSPARVDTFTVRQCTGEQDAMGSSTRSTLALINPCNDA